MRARRRGPRGLHVTTVYEPDGTLQCGHGGEAVEDHRSGLTGAVGAGCFNAATAVRPWRTDISVGGTHCFFGLQCGHGGEAVEDRPNAVRRRGARGFNAATAVRPWRTR